MLPRLLVRLSQKGKVASIARKLTGYTTQDEGQERQEAKTQDCQEDKRPETLVKGNGNNMECFRLREKQGVLIANMDCKAC
ncbi:hypothetical protein [Citrobacter sp. Marseille-Q3906]|uniref:hypothetical protein n=1 Tax=Citrobacter sp. Marseille-Q3906 TaxID=2866574 RepID=UPI001CE3CF00|nr:hypothetical protein [Citrobacter sp. Marseille-Q3906]